MVHHSFNVEDMYDDVTPALSYTTHIMTWLACRGWELWHTQWVIRQVRKLHCMELYGMECQPTSAVLYGLLFVSGVAIGLCAVRVRELLVLSRLCPNELRQHGCPAASDVVG